MSEEELLSTGTYKKTLARINSDANRFGEDYVKAQIYGDTYLQRWDSDKDGYYGTSKLEMELENVIAAIELAEKHVLARFKGEYREKELEQQKANQEKDSKWNNYVVLLEAKQHFEARRKCGMKINKISVEEYQELLKKLAKAKSELVDEE